MKKKEFDLTNALGLSRSVAISGLPYWYGNQFALIKLLVELIKYAIDRITKILDSSELVDMQRKTAEDLIMAGSRAGAEEIEITMDQDAGAKLDLNLSGIKIAKVKLGNEGKMKIHVKYSSKSKE